MHKSGTIVAEGYIHFPNGDLLVVAPNYDEERRLNPILREPAYATKRHRKGLEFHLLQEPAEIGELRLKLAKYDRAIQHKRIVSKPIYDKTQAKLNKAYGDYQHAVREYAKTLRKNASEDPQEALESGILFVPNNKVLPGFDTDKFSSYPIIKFIFADYAEPLCELLQGKGRKSVPHITPNAAYMKLNRLDLPFCRPLWIHSIGYGLNISSQINLCEHNTVFGLSLTQEDDFEEIEDSSAFESDEEADDELEVPPDDSSAFENNSPTQIVDDGHDSLAKSPRNTKAPDDIWVD